MKKTFKRFMAFVMTGVLLASPLSSAVANATVMDTKDSSPASGSAVASGEVEGYVDTEVFKVVLPTSVDANTFKFILDPQGLINKTSGAAYAGSTFASGDSVYFETASGNYTNTSKNVTVVNKGTVAVNVSVEATVLSADDVTLSASSDFADTTPSLYLALQEVSGDAKAIDEEDGATLTKELAAASADFYEYKYDASADAYDYDIKAAYASADYVTGFPSFSFNMTGACNTAADWEDLEEAAPSVKVVWTLTNANALQTEYTFNGSTDVVISYEGTAPAAGSITFTTPKNTTWTPAANTYGTNIIVNDSAKTITLKAAWFKSATANLGGKGDYTFTLNGNDYTVTYQ